MSERSTDHDEGSGLLGSLWRFRVVLLVAALAGVAAGLAVVAVRPATYEASVRIVLDEPTRDPKTGRPSADPSRVLLNEAALLGSNETFAGAAERHGQGMTADAVRDLVTIHPSREADVITIRALGPTPDGATRLAGDVLAAGDALVGEATVAGANAELEALRRERADRSARKHQIEDALRAGGGAAAATGANGDAEASDEALHAELEAIERRLEVTAARQVELRKVAEQGANLGGLRELPDASELASLPVRPDAGRTILVWLFAGLGAGLVATWSLGSRARAVAVAAAAKDTGPPAPRPARRKVRPFRWFTPSLAVLLAGYLFFSRSFAYLTVPGLPVYPGEMVLVLGVVEAVRARKLIRARFRLTPPLKALAAFMALCAARLLVDLPTYRLDAIRDSAVWYYATYAFLVALAVSVDPTFTGRLLGWFRRILPWFLLWVPVSIVIATNPRFSTVTVPGSDTPINSFKAGDLSVLTASVVAFLWLGLERAGHLRPERRRSDLLTVVGVLALVVLTSQSRGGTLAIAAVLGTALLCCPMRLRRRVVATATAGALAVLLPLLALDVKVDTGGRELSVRQVAVNTVSLVASSAASDVEAETGLNATVSWRKEYFGAVIADSLSASHILTGQGFGPILSYRYIRNQSQAAGDAPLRNAHNSHLTILARTGVPGFLLWVILLLTWLWRVGRVALHGRSGTTDPAVAIATWTAGAVLGFCVLAATDPSLEGPQGGVWFWSLLGLGAAHAEAWRRERLAARSSPGPVPDTVPAAWPDAVAVPVPAGADPTVPLDPDPDPWAAPRAPGRS